MTAQTDLELLAAFQAGDASAGNRLFDRHFTSVYAFFRSKAGDDAEDLVQQTFAACIAARPQMRGEATFRTYLFTAARRKLYDWLHRRRREDAHIDWGVTSMVDLNLDPSPSSVMARSELHELLARALRQIPVDFQVALELFYFEQLAGPELAAVLEIPEGTVRTRIRRARTLLREQLATLTEDPKARTLADAALDAGGETP